MHWKLFMKKARCSIKETWNLAILMLFGFTPKPAFLNSKVYFKRLKMFPFYFLINFIELSYLQNTLVKSAEIFQVFNSVKVWNIPIKTVWCFSRFLKLGCTHPTSRFQLSFFDSSLMGAWIKMQFKSCWS